MTEVGIRELRQNLSVYLRRVKAGERLTVTERNRPVAEIRPLAGEDRLSQLIAEGTVRASKRPWNPSALPPPLDLDDPEAGTRALQEQRAERL